MDNQETQETLVVRHRTKKQKNKPQHRKLRATQNPQKKQG